MKRTAIAFALTLAALALGAQQVTKVGICDFSRVLNTSYRESKTVREFYEAQQTIKKEAEGGKVEEIEKITKDNAVIYEADILKDGKRIEIKVDSDGKLLKKKVEDDDEDRDEDNEDDDND